MGLVARWRARFDRVWNAALRRPSIAAAYGAYRRALAYAWRRPLPRRNPVLRYVIDLLVFLAAAGALAVLVVLSVWATPGPYQDLSASDHPMPGPVVALCVILAVLAAASWAA